MHLRLARANIHARAYISLLERPPADDGVAGGASTAHRGKEPAVRRERSGITSLLGTNEQHADEFNDAFGEVVGLLNKRSDAAEAGGTGLWSEVRCCKSSQIGRLLLLQSPDLAAAAAPEPNLAAAWRLLVGW